jgi:hypothetical protein
MTAIAWSGTSEIFRLKEADKVAAEREAKLARGESILPGNALGTGPDRPLPKAAPILYEEPAPPPPSPAPEPPRERATPSRPKIAIARKSSTARMPVQPAPRSPRALLRPTSGDAVLVTYPLPAALTQVQVETLTRTLGLDASQATAAFAGSVPRIARRRSAAELTPVVSELEAVDLPCLVVAAEALLGPVQPVTVNATRTDGASLVLEGPEGSKKLGERPALVVTGRRPDSPLLFAHVYFSDGVRPFELHEEDFASPGFPQVLASIQAARGERNDLLERNAGDVGDAAAAALEGEPPVPPVTILSRVLFYTWIS